MRTHFLVGLALFAGLSFAGMVPFKAYVDNNTVADGDSLTLTLELAARAAGEPDLSELKQSFDILSQSMSSESSYINGSSSQKTKWILEIRPKSSAPKVIIPPIKMAGYASDRIEISQKAEKSSGSERGLSLIASTKTDKVYVNGEIIFNLELKTSLPLRNGNLGKPEIKDAIVETLVEDDNREVMENGIRSQIFHRSYAIYPSKAGELVIPSIAFEGLVADSSSRGWFSGGRRMGARSKAITIKVADVPKSYPKDRPFLPLKSLAVIESFDSQDPKFEVNKATTRRFEIKALGTLSSFLPVVEAHQQAGLKVYTETGLKVHKNTEEGMEASIKFSHVYMPTVPGTVTIPEQTIYWWDTDKDELKTTVIRAFEFSVTGETNSSSVSPPAPATAPFDEAAPTKKPATEEHAFNVWALIAGIFAALWIVTAGAWFYRARGFRVEKNKAKAPDIFKNAVNDLIRAAKNGEARLSYRCLKALQLLVVQKEPNSQALPQINLLISELEQAIYGERDQERISQVLKKVSTQAEQFKSRSDSTAKLSELYPN